MKILVFGNPLVNEDSLPLAMLPELRKLFPQIEFKEADGAESIEREGRDLVILDAAQGIAEVALLEGVEALETGKIHSMHDFDVALTLKLLLKTGAIDSVRIIAVPIGYPKAKAMKEAGAIISTLLSGSA